MRHLFPAVKLPMLLLTQDFKDYGSNTLFKHGSNRIVDPLSVEIA